MNEKAALRREVRALYPGAEERDRQSKALCGHVAAWRAYREARVIGGYVPLKREADVTPLLRDALARGKTLVLPRVEENGAMTFRRVESLQSLVSGAFGIPEPARESAAVEIAAVDLLLVPLEAIDPSGMRLGKGGGYYDRVLPDFEGVSAGMAMSWQWVERVPCRAWDMRLDAAVDCRGVHVFGKTGGLRDGRADEQQG